MYCKDEVIDFSVAEILSEDSKKNVIKDQNHSVIPKIKQDDIETFQFEFEESSSTIQDCSGVCDPSWRVHETSATNKLVEGVCDEKVNVKDEKINYDVTIQNSKQVNSDKRRISRDDKVSEQGADSNQVLTLHREVDIKKTETESNNGIFYLNKSDIDSKVETSEHGADLKQVLTLHHEVDIEKTESDDDGGIVYLDKSDIDVKGETEDELGNDLGSDADSRGHQDKDKSVSDSSPVFKVELKTHLRDVLIDSRTSAKIKLRDLRIPLTRLDLSGTKHVNVSRPEIPTFAQRPRKRYGQSTDQFRSDRGSDYHVVKPVKHAKVKPFQCSICPSGFYSEKSYSVHLWQNHKSQIPNLREKLMHLFESCPFCDYIAINQCKLKRHMGKHGLYLERKALECKYCSYKSFNKMNYSAHMRKRHTKKELHCDYCDYVSRNEISIANHMLRSHQKQTENFQSIGKFTIYNCTQCDYKCISGKRLMDHNLIHKKIFNLAPQKTYTCLECNQTVKSKNSLINHLKIHKAVKQFKCEHCFESFTGEKVFYRHLLNQHKQEIPNLKYFKCKHCSADFTEKIVFHSHLLHQHKQEIPNLEEFFGDKLYSCNVCNFKTVYGSCYKDHMLIHEDSAETQRYHCHTCSFKTIHKSSIRKHVTTHQDEKKFKCDFCQAKSYDKKLDFAHHLLVHHKNDEAAQKLFQSMKYKVYSCKLCPLECVASSQFKKHMFRVHNDISYATEQLKRFIPCPKCDFKAECQAVLKRHMGFHELERQYKVKYNCKMCQRRFLKKNNLTIHIRKHKQVLGPRTLKTNAVSFKGHNKTYDSSIGDNYQCYNCRFESESKSSLKKHISTHKLIKTN